ncbi:hypothetical protein G7Y89_g8054 [Cudoniella acicularis]|uniref:Uncharacterized protein n=1 Tax=Cudoniella acicularis TaxID=354080 RepID=A0A8H4RK21_9HELO|nr:hypothetical protein G7Y89_g8054 [Cudoniella acicularis]
MAFPLRRMVALSTFKGSASTCACAPKAVNQHFTSEITTSGNAKFTNTLPQLPKLIHLPVPFINNTICTSGALASNTTLTYPKKPPSYKNIHHAPMHDLMEAIGSGPFKEENKVVEKGKAYNRMSEDANGERVYRAFPGGCYDCEEISTCENEELRAYNTKHDASPYDNDNFSEAIGTVRFKDTLSEETFTTSTEVEGGQEKESEYPSVSSTLPLFLSVSYDYAPYSFLLKSLLMLHGP